MGGAYECCRWSLQAPETWEASVVPHPLLGMPRRKRQTLSQCKRRKLERESSAPGDVSISSVPTSVASVPPVGSVTPQGSVLSPQGSVAAAADGSRSVPAAPVTSSAVPAVVVTTSPTTADATIDDDYDGEGTVLAGVHKRMSLVSGLKLFNAGNVPGKSMDTIVDGLILSIVCSDCGNDLGLQCTHLHLGVVSVAVTCACRPNVQTHKEPTTKALNGKASRLMGKNLSVVYSTLITGIGQAGCAVFCNSLGASAINKRPYYNHCHFLFNNMELLLKHFEHSAVPTQ